MSISGKRMLVEGCHGIPLWNPYIFSCRTKDEILVCLKYCLGSICENKHLVYYFGT